MKRTHKLAFYIESDPRLEASGNCYYPSLRFYLGLMIAFSDAIGSDDLVLISRNKINKDIINSDIDNDYHIASMLKNIKLLDYTTEDDFEVLVSTNLQARPEKHRKRLDKLCERCDRFIYLDSDSEPASKSKVTLFNYLIEGNGSNILNKLDAVVFTEGTNIIDKWKFVKDSINLVFIPYILHPYYTINSKPSLSYNHKTIDIATLRSTSSKRIYNIINSSRVQDLSDNKLSVKHKTCKDLELELSSAKLFLGTMIDNVGVGNEFRVTSKVIESLHSNCLPTFIDCYEEFEDNRYEYLKLIPDYLKVLRSSKKVNINKLLNLVDTISNMDEWNFDQLIDLLYKEVYNYHNPNKWINKIKEEVFHYE